MPAPAPALEVGDVLTIVVVAPGVWPEVVVGECGMNAQVRPPAATTATAEHPAMMAVRREMPRRAGSGLSCIVVGRSIGCRGGVIRPGACSLARCGGVIKPGGCSYKGWGGVIKVGACSMGA